MAQLPFTASTSYISALEEGFTWSGTTGVASTVTYNFGNSVEGGNIFNLIQQAQARAAMQVWADVANISFQSGGLGALTFSQKNLGASTAGLASTLFINTQILSSEVQISNTVASVATGTFGFLTLVHEIGHAIGMKHPGNYSGSESGPFLPAAEDSIQTTVMSYNNSALVNELTNAPTTPMIYDIATIQELYGANHNFNSGNNSYIYDGSRQTLTIWDGGGNADIISAGSYGGGSASIDLREGINNVTHIGQTIALIAFGANIENAAGSTSNDSIVGNDLANQLFGGNGADNLIGLRGDDTLYGGDGIADPDDGSDILAGSGGSDVLYGNTGNDILYGGGGIADAETGNDTIYGGFGTDAIYGNAGDDSLFGGGSAGDSGDLGDTIAGGKGADFIAGNGGDDIIYGGGAVSDSTDGGDFIFGGFGNDTIFGNGGADTVYGQNGNDVLNAGLDNDIYAFTNDSGTDTILFFEGAGSLGGDVIQLASNINNSGIMTVAQAVAAIVVGTDGAATLDLGGGNHITIVGVGSSLSLGDFTIL